MVLIYLLKSIRFSINHLKDQIVPLWEYLNDGILHGVCLGESLSSRSDVLHVGAQFQLLSAVDLRLPVGLQRRQTGKQTGAPQYEFSVTGGFHDAGGSRCWNMPYTQPTALCKDIFVRLRNMSAALHPSEPIRLFALAPSLNFFLILRIPLASLTHGEISHIAPLCSVHGIKLPIRLTVTRVPTHSERQGK
jgi:hypothetical protein